MKFITIILAVLMMVATGYTQSYVDCIINNFQKSADIYSFDLRANRTSGPTFNVGTSTFTIKVNPAAFTYADVQNGGIRATISLANINPRYSGGWNVGEGNYKMMTRTIYTYNGNPQRCEVGVYITHWDGYPSSELLPDELICTVRLQIYDSSKTTGISWSTTGGMVALSPGSVISNFVGSDNNPLPITLSSFDVNAINGTANVTWTTVSEINNFGFFVEKSADNHTWTPVTFIQGHGTTLIPQTYSYTDATAKSSAYYRLKQVDLNGDAHYSDGVRFDLPAKFDLSQNYPNPFNPSTTIKYELAKTSDVRLSVHDMLGHEVATVVNERSDAGVHEVKFDASGLSSGVYFYRLQTGDFTQTKRLMLLK